LLLAQFFPVKECKRLGLEYVPILYDNATAQPKKSPQEVMPELIKSIEEGKIRSILSDLKTDNAVRPEGIVLKHPRFRSESGKVVCVKQKFVTSAFKERHAHGSKGKPGERSPLDFIVYLGKQFANPARLVKAKQHLVEACSTVGVPLSTPRRNGIADWMIREELDHDLMKEFAKPIKNHLIHEFHW